LEVEFLVLGLTFKENCPDLRNTKVVDLIRALEAYKTKVDIFDPWIDLNEAWLEYGLRCLDGTPDRGVYHAIILAVGHREFEKMGAEGIRALGETESVVFDVKGILAKHESDFRL